MTVAQNVVVARVTMKQSVKVVNCAIVVTTNIRSNARNAEPTVVSAPVNSTVELA